MKNTDKAKGAFFGLAVGDALGTPLEFKTRDTYTHLTDMVGGGPFNLAPGEWTDDTSMALGLAQALVDHGMNQIEILKNFRAWREHGKFSHNNRCFDIGNTTSAAIRRFAESKETEPVCGSGHFMDSGNGGIMRLAPAVLFANTQIEAIQYSVDQSVTTHSSEDCVQYAMELGDMLWRLINDESYERTFMSDHADMANMDRIDISSSGYVVHTFEASCWSVANTDNFKDAVLLAVNLGDDADTVGAVTGQIAGAMYGYEAIPTEWLYKLAWHDKINELCEQLI